MTIVFTLSEGGVACWHFESFERVYEMKKNLGLALLLTLALMSAACTNAGTPSTPSPRSSADTPSQPTEPDPNSSNPTKPTAEPTSTPMVDAAEQMPTSPVPVAVDDGKDPSIQPDGANSEQGGTNGYDISQVESVFAETMANPALEKAIAQELDGYEYCPAKGLESNGTRYFYNETDLNGDGNAEAIAYLVGSYTCGSGGCTTLIFEPIGTEYQLVSRLSLVNHPMIVSDQTTQGWKDLILPVAGGGAEADYHVLRFDGSGYPGNPSVAPVVPIGTKITGQAVITHEITADTPAPIVKSADCE